MNADLMLHARDAKVVIKEVKETTYRCLKINIESPSGGYTTVGIFLDLNAPKVVFEQ